MGDRAIIGRNEVGMGSMAEVENLDANSKGSEAYSEPRRVGSQTVYLRPEDAAKFDAESGEKSWSVNFNGHTWDRIKAALDELRGK